MPLVSFAELATYYLIAINFLAFAAFGYDKAQAESGGWRVSEATLVNMVVVGGLFGALAGRQMFRHKTRKGRFNDKLWGGAIGSVLLFGGLYFFLPRLPIPLTPQERVRLEQVMASVHYSGCNEVRGAGKAPLHYGEPGYDSSMDGDGDGVACEPQF